MVLLKKITKTFFVVCGILAVLLIAWWFIRQEAPLFDGIWANENGSFILDTETFTATITTDNGSETLLVGYTPGIDFAMYYPPPEGTASVYAGDFIHRGDIYRIKFLGIDGIRVKCEDGCFDVWLRKR